jgi:hypothetical protein
VNVIIVKWSQTYSKGITLPTSKKIITTLFANDQLIIGDSEDYLQRGVFTLTT